MRYTNLFNYPDAIAKALENNKYYKGDADYSVSSLATPPKIVHLMSRHGEHISTDISENMFALFGTSIHYILEKAENRPSLSINPYLIKDILNDKNSKKEKIEALNQLSSETIRAYEDYSPLARTEERLYARMAGVTISGQFDRYDTVKKTIEDWKVTSVFKIKSKNFEEYTFRMNTYRWLFYMNKIEVKNLVINAIMRDWRRNEALRSSDYPLRMVEQIKIKMLSMMDIHDLITEKVKGLEAAKLLEDDDIPICSEKDRWKRPDKFGVKKPANSRNSKVFESKEEAEDFIREKGSQYVLNIKAGEDLRCKEFCAVKDFCNYYKSNYGSEIQDVDLDLNKDIKVNLDVKEDKSPEINKILEDLKPPKLVPDIPKSILSEPTIPIEYSTKDSTEDSTENISLNDLMG